MLRRKRFHQRFLSRARRGFALPLVILLLLISSMTIVVIMQRQTAQTRLVEEMIADYHTHHAAFGVRAIVRKWLGSNRGRDLSDFAKGNEVSFRFILPNDVYVSIWIQDAQGIPVATPTDIGPANVEYYREIVSRIETTRPGSFRARGPSAISIASAPRHVLQALVEDEKMGLRLADRIIRTRERKSLDRNEMMNQLRRAGLEDDEIARVVAISTFDPILWRINVLSDDRKHRNQRYFVMHAEIVGGQPSVTSWEELIGVDPADPFAEKPTKTNRENGETADLNDNNKTDNQSDDDSAEPVNNN